MDRLSSGAPWEPVYGYSRAVRCGDLVYVAGTTAAGEDGVVLSVGDPGGQVHAIVDIIERALTGAGARIDQVVQTRIYVTDISRADEVGRAHAERFGGAPPASAMVQVAALMDPQMLVEIEAVAYVGDV
ncbi:MAG: RidA family protein [Solirubrobacterales bacterium]|nr:RidA family protein [Solirubrobacterales bacterium]